MLPGRRGSQLMSHRRSVTRQASIPNEEVVRRPLLGENVYYYPFALKANRYCDLQRGILAGLGARVQPIGAVFGDVLRRKRGTAVVSFLEDRVAYHHSRRTLTLVQNVALLAGLRLACRQVIWIRHNYWPHELSRTSRHERIMLACMKGFSTKVVTHREVPGIVSRILPHPLYFEGTLRDDRRDIQFLFFGKIVRYKGLETLLASWPAREKLVIAGPAPDQGYLHEIEQLVRSRGLLVEMRVGFLSDLELDDLLMRSRFVLHTHQDDTAIVSGTFYHAASFGANILAVRAYCSEYYSRTFSFVTLYDSAKLPSALANLKYVDPDVVTKELRAVNGTEPCRDAWQRILGPRK